MREAVIVSTARTGLAKSFRGGLNDTEAPAMGGHVVRAVVERAGLDPRRKVRRRGKVGDRDAPDVPPRRPAAGDQGRDQLSSQKPAAAQQDDMGAAQWLFLGRTSEVL